MKQLYIITAAAFALLAGPAFADDHTCQGAGNCNVGVQDNSTTTNNVPIAVGVGVGGEGGSVNHSGNSFNVNGLHQDQEQQQQQQQQQSLDNRNYNANISANENKNINKNDANANAGSASISGAAASNKGNKQDVQINTYNPGKIEYSGSYTVRNVPNFAIGGPASGACNGFSATLGGAVAGFGAGGGVSLLDKTCVCDRLAGRFAHLAQIALQAGDTNSYNRLMQKSEKMAASGEECLTVLANEEQASKQAAAPAPQVVAAANPPAKQPAGCVADPYIAMRTDKPVCK